MTNVSIWPPIGSEMNSDLTVLVFGKTRSSLVRWFISHEELLIKSKKKCILGYFYHDEIDIENLFFELKEKITWVCGPENAWLRILKMLENVETTHILLVGSDDRICSLPTNESIFKKNQWVAGRYFFEEGGKLRQSTNNLIRFNENINETLIDYWSVPNPSDNSIFYSIISKERCIFEISYYNECIYDAKDWEIVSSRIMESKSLRAPDLIIFREQSPHDSYSQRVIDRYEKKKINYANWVFQNPALLAIKKISDKLPYEVRGNCVNSMIFILLIKFRDMKKLSVEYSNVMEGFDLQKTAENLVKNLSNIALEQIEVPFSAPWST